MILKRTITANQRPKIHPSTQRQFPAKSRVIAGKNKALSNRFRTNAIGDIFLLTVSILKFPYKVKALLASCRWQFFVSLFFCAFYNVDLSSTTRVKDQKMSPQCQGLGQRVN